MRFPIPVRSALLPTLLLALALVLACPARHGGDDDDADDADDDMADDTGDDTSDDASDDSGDDSGDDTGGEAAIVSTERTDCKNGGKEAKDDWPQSLTFDYADDLLTVTHVNGVFNCCLERIDVTMELDGFVLDLYEVEFTPDPCFCECPFDVTTRIAGLGSGAYTVNVYDDGAFDLSGQVTIP